MLLFVFLDTSTTICVAISISKDDTFDSYFKAMIAFLIIEHFIVYTGLLVIRLTSCCNYCCCLSLILGPFGPIIIYFMGGCNHTTHRSDFNINGHNHHDDGNEFTKLFVNGCKSNPYSSNRHYFETDSYLFDCKRVGNIDYNDENKYYYLFVWRLQAINKHLGFLSHCFAHSIPQALIQFFVLIDICDDNYTFKFGINDKNDISLQLVLIVSIFISLISIGFKLILLIPSQYFLFPSIFVWNVAAIFCDIVLVLSIILWIFMDVKECVGSYESNNKHYHDSEWFTQNNYLYIWLYFGLSLLISFLLTLNRMCNSRFWFAACKRFCNDMSATWYEVLCISWIVSLLSIIFWTIIQSVVGFTCQTLAFSLIIHETLRHDINIDYVIFVHSAVYINNQTWKMGFIMTLIDYDDGFHLYTVEDKVQAVKDSIDPEIVKLTAKRRELLYRLNPHDMDQVENVLQLIKDPLKDSIYIKNLQNKSSVMKTCVRNCCCRRFYHCCGAYYNDWCRACCFNSIFGLYIIDRMVMIIIPMFIFMHQAVNINDDANYSLQGLRFGLSCCYIFGMIVFVWILIQLVLPIYRSYFWLKLIAKIGNKDHNQILKQITQRYDKCLAASWIDYYLYKRFGNDIAHIILKFMGDSHLKCK